MPQERTADLSSPLTLRGGFTPDHGGILYPENRISPRSIPAGSQSLVPGPLLLVLVLLLGAGPALSATFTVSNTVDAGAGSLRQAIQDANGSAGLDTIVFAIPGSGPFTIQPLTMLPVVTDPVVIDGTTQPGSGGVPIVELNGSSVGSGSDGLRITAGGSETPVLDEFVRVRSAGCTTTCDAADVYRLSALETTGFIARFNNSASQITVLVVQNVGDQAVDLDVRFWSPSGAPLGGPPVQTLGPRQAYVLNTSSIVPGASGSISVGNTGRYGQLGGKAVAVEPATGFTFDTGLELRSR